MNGNELPVVGAAIGCCSSPVKELFPKEGEEEKEEAFINTGLQNWEKGREKWLKDNGNGNANNNGNISNTSTSVNGKRSRGGPGTGAVDLNVDEIIDCIVSNRWRSAMKGGKDKAVFPQAVPLPQMIDILTDLWEAEGLDV